MRTTANQPHQHPFHKRHWFWMLALSGFIATGCSSTPTAEPEPTVPSEPVTISVPEQESTPPIQEPVLAVQRKILYFDFDSAELTPRSQQVLSELVTAARNNELMNSRIVIAGHADATGPEVYNDALSEARAKTVESFLRSKLDPSEWTVQSFGETQPTASNDNAQGREQNRRVVVDYVASNKPLAMN
ncbi:OmpA family protein [Ketobacter sp.]|uniref:OmpA family protein n=1 Tax=Ketobacter sp. TaxID=2083498 RepID=UPI0025B842DF|nr:OmpA family protein [Ketobacter sp.]